MQSIVNMFPGSTEKFQQAVAGDIQDIKEYNSPVYNLLRSNFRKIKVGEKGYKIIYNNLIAGGHSTPTATRPDWNEPGVNEELSSYAYPVRYRLPMIFDHAVLRDYKAGLATAGWSLARELATYVTIAMKRLERAAILDGSGSLAYSTSNLTAVGAGQTMNCDTTPSTSAGHTKGAKWLEKNSWYQAIVVSTGLPRGLFQVTATGSTSCVVNLVQGTVASGDPIVNLNTYNGFARGLAHLISGANRIVQGINTADVPDMNSYDIDLALAPFTFVAVEDLLVGLRIRTNDSGKNSKVLIAPPGQMSVIRKSAQNLRVYNDGTNVIQGIAEDVDFGKNITVIEAADMDEDRIYALVYKEFGMIEPMPLDVVDIDGREWRMLLGANNSGSERYQRGIGTDYNFIRRGNAQSSALIIRASVTGVLTQAGI